MHGAQLMYFFENQKQLKTIERSAFPKTIGFEEKDLDQLLSFTFSCDVVAVINRFIDRSINLTSKFQAFNIACPE